MSKIVVDGDILRNIETIADKRLPGRIKGIRKLLAYLREKAVPVEEKTVFFERFYK